MTKNNVIVLVAVENTTFSFDMLYSYAVPSNLVYETEVGKRVIVPFGGGNRSRTGMIFKIETQVIDESNFEHKRVLKYIKNVIDDEPIINSKQLEICEYVVKQTFCTYYDAVNLFIPTGMRLKCKVNYKIDTKIFKELKEEFTDIQLEILNYIKKNSNSIKEETLMKKVTELSALFEFEILVNKKVIIKVGDWVRNIGDESVKMVRLCDIEDDTNEPIFVPDLTEKQKAVVEILEKTAASVKEVCYYAGVTPSVIDNLVKKSFAEYYEYAVFRNPYDDAQKTNTIDNLVLTDEQQQAYLEIVNLMEQDKANAALLFGVTGSGKTAVFLKAISKCIQNGKNVIVMVPEIALTAQTISRFHAYFGQSVAIIHSGLSVGERLDEWKRSKEDNVKIVVGTRSAIFAPIGNLGLIVIDEEQEHTYKSDKTPRYHARDIAKFRCVQDNAMLLLASATPDIESFYNAKTGKYALIKLKNRYNCGPLPETTVINMKKQGGLSERIQLSDVLCEEIEENLKRGEQTIILNNRRGFSTTVACRECKTIETCPNCSISLTYHKANGHLMCHYCGFSKEIFDVCPTCGSSLIKYTGAGTQNIQQQLSELFPDARILRMDQDTTMAKFSHDKYFKAFADGEYDILIGTQMVAKGLDFPNVTLVGMLGADRAIYSGDFKGSERAFSLITQVVGRCGRGDKKGRAYIQTLDDSSGVIAHGCAQDYEAYYEEEIQIRKMLTYPPFCDICSVGFSGIYERDTENCAYDFLEELKQKVYNKYNDIPIKALGPSKMTVFRVSNKFRYKIIIKCKNNARFRMLMREIMTEFSSQKRKVSIIIDFSSEISF